MPTIQLLMKHTGEPLKRFPVTILADNMNSEIKAYTDRNGIVSLSEVTGSGRIFVDGHTHYQGNLDKKILIEMWS
ncbi:MAG: sulfurtransferase TusE, partial [Gammaproteobacteria bacterium]|nr:sulfurtransferase TusE [Gammaproteobacteria bacterium]